MRRLQRAFSFLLLVAASLPLRGDARARNLVTGRLHIIWDLPRDAQHPDGRAYYLVDAAGNAQRLDLRTAGIPEAELMRADRGQIDVEFVEEGSPRVGSFRLRVPDMPALRPNVFGSVTARPFITVLCKFADDLPPTSLPDHFKQMVGGSYPGMAHFYGELAQDANVMAGNSVAGWFTLPRPRSAYIANNIADFATLSRDCAQAADATVFFPDFYGVNFQFSGPLINRSTPPYDALSLGGSFTLALDGQVRTYGATWLSADHSGNYVVYSHEMGHALGWPHSSGRYGQEYDSRWDIMSAGYLHWDPTFGSLGIHTIAPYKMEAGWIPASRVMVAPVGSTVSGVIERSALPTNSTDFLAAEVLLGNEESYIVETRRIAGYDATLPGEAVVIHSVFRGRAYVVDPDENGNPNDEGAMWRPGETFTDLFRNLSIRVDSATLSGFHVTITHGEKQLVILGDAERKFGVVGSSYADTLRVYNSAGSEVWSHTDGQLPPGLVLQPSTGVINGTPTAPGSYSFTVSVNEPPLTGTKAMTINVYAPLTLNVQSPPSAGSVGTPYAHQLVASGGTGSYRWSATNLPSGLSMDTAGLIQGVPATAGDFGYEVRVVSGPQSLTWQFTMQIHTAVVIAGAATRKEGFAGYAYADTLIATGGTGNASFTIAAGALPQGLTLGTEGIITGTPTTAGNYEVTIEAVAGPGRTRRTFSFRVNPRPVLARSAVFDHLFGRATPLDAVQLRFLDTIGNNNSRFDIGDVRAWLIDQQQIPAERRL